MCLVKQKTNEEIKSTIPFIESRHFINITTGAIETINDIMLKVKEIQLKPEIDSIGIAGYEIFEKTDEGLIYRGSASTPSVMIKKEELSCGILYREKKRMVGY